MGKVCSKAKMPSIRIQNPKNLDTIASNTNFTFTLQAQNIALGSFADAASTYFAAPADVDGQGQYIGHTHLAVQKTQSLTSTELLDSQNFTFFQGINAPQDKNGEISITVTGLPEGTYRMCTISTAANHQTLNGPVAQRGHFDDCIQVSCLSKTAIDLVRRTLPSQITAKDGGGQSNNATGTTTVNNNNGTASNSVNNKTGTNNTTSTNNKSGTKNKSGANNNKEDATDTDTGDCKDDNQGTTNNGKTGHKTTGNGNDKDNSQKTINAGNNNGTTQNTNGTSNGQKTDATAKHHNNTNTNGTTKSGDKGTTNDTSCDT
jgi:transcription initiation factor TFIID subunit 15